MNDLRFAGRQLAKAPGFTIAALVTLALGIGANTAMFSLVNGILLRPLPYDEAGRLVHVWEAPRPGQRNSVSPGVFSDWREHATTLESLAAFSFVDWNLTGEGGPEAIVNEAFVREHFPGDDPLGMRIEEGRQSWEIVGVIGDVRSRGLAERVRPIFYRPLAFSHWANGRLIVRARAAPLSLSETVRKAILEVDPDLPVSNIRSLEEVVAASVAPRRLTLLLLALFAAAALLLAAVGLYGVVAYTVTERTREIGIRMALGAQRADVFGMVLRQGARLGGLGIVPGAGVALALTRVLASQLYHVKPTDPATLAGVALLLFAVALLASWLPARRAASLDPMGALR